MLFPARERCNKRHSVRNTWCLEKHKYSDVNEVLGLVNERGKSKSNEIRIRKCQVMCAKNWNIIISPSDYSVGRSKFLSSEMELPKGVYELNKGLV